MSEPLPRAALDRLFLTSRSVNRYSDRSVTPETLHAIYDLAKWGPTSVNSQPMRVTWCLGQEAKDRLAALTSGSNPAKVRAAPAVAIVAMALDFYEHLPRLFPSADARAWFAGDEPLAEENAFRNSTLQGAYLIMAARALGLDCGAMSGIDRAGIDRAFFSGTKLRTNFIMTLGYGDGDPASAHPRGPRLTFDEAAEIL